MLNGHLGMKVFRFLVGVWTVGCGCESGKFGKPGHRAVIKGNPGGGQAGYGPPYAWPFEVANKIMPHLL